MCETVHVYIIITWAEVCVCVNRARRFQVKKFIRASYNRACKSRGETMRDFRLPEPFDYRSDILTLKSLSRKSSLCLRTP